MFPEAPLKPITFRDVFGTESKQQEGTVLDPQPGFYAVSNMVMAPGKSFPCSELPGPTQGKGVAG